VQGAARWMVGMLVFDAWQYCIHRAMHESKWLYNSFHSVHHRLLIPYAWGALYNHPVEAFLLDTLGSLVTILVPGAGRGGGGAAQRRLGSGPGTLLAPSGCPGLPGVSCPCACAASDAGWRLHRPQA